MCYLLIVKLTLKGEGVLRFFKASLRFAIGLKLISTMDIIHYSKIFISSL